MEAEPAETGGILAATKLKVVKIIINKKYINREIKYLVK
jgi:hypothetical protein